MLLRQLTLGALTLSLMGCPYLPESTFQDKIRDADGDGVMGDRFGGEDCLDDDPTVERCDVDGDGERSFAAGGGDCNDEDPTIHPGADERCNQVDDDCDGLVDDADDDVVEPLIWFADSDGDGFGDVTRSWSRCEAPPAYVADDRDCDDNRDDVHPGATEFCDDLDRNCDGDGYIDAVDPLDWYTDADGDGYGTGESVAKACQAPAGTAATNDDCDDTAATAWPGAPEIWYDGIDQDCLGGSDWDADGDGFDQQPTGLDCDDDDASVSPVATEICDAGVDNNCNGVADNDDFTTESFGQWTYYLDADGDGFGDPFTAQLFCPNTQPAGWILISGDCDDTLSTVLPGGVELCDNRDNDCDGVVDDGAIGMVDFYVDGDGDGFGGPTIQPACDLGPGLSNVGGDCNDADPQTYPGAPEICGDLFRQDCTALSISDCDSDGFEDVAAGGTDCNDAEAEVYPGANEVCDGLDNNCSGLVDDDDPLVDLSTVDDWYRDDDGDGYGTTQVVIANACAPIPGAATNSEDCDDTDPNTYPGAVEICDGLDNTCEGLVDEGPIIDPPTYYFDSDGDGFGNPVLVSAIDCAPPGPDWVLDNTDCQDAFAEVHPLALEVCDGLDNDCDGLVDDADPSVASTLWYVDGDLDGYGQDGVAISQCDQPAGYTAFAGDCNDFDASINPGASELCDGGIDNDCDGLGDDADPDLAAAITWYPDSDGDGFGDAQTFLVQCTAPAGWVNNGADCDDAQAAVSPAAIELCDGSDNDCDGQIDDEDSGLVGAPFWFSDADGDAWGDETSFVQACSPPPDMLPQAGDCDDTDATVHPGADEVCDGSDNDCDGLTDDADPSNSPIYWYADSDMDGFGDAAVFTTQCTAPVGLWTTDSSDCDDADNSVSPLAPEICNFVDDNCDGQVDDDDPSVSGQPIWYADADGDGWGDSLLPTPSCEPPFGYVPVGGDCDDTNLLANPGEIVELCNGFDDNCDGLVDDADPMLVNGDEHYVDADGDGYGDATDPGTELCGATPGYSAVASDCDDTDSAVHPAADEVCDTVDNDCDSFIDADDASLTDGMNQYPDYDGDGYGLAALETLVCDPIAGWVSDSSDCNDFDADIWPGATETCDGVDNDCNAVVDDVDPANLLAWYRDTDWDGYGATGTEAFACDDPWGNGSLLSGDCNDNDPSIFPNADEYCDGMDNDCDGLIDDQDVNVIGSMTWYGDLDEDGWAGNVVTLEACDPPAGFLPWYDDCDDFDPMISPNEPEICDGLDNDCDGLVDDDDPNVSGSLFLLDADGDGYGNSSVVAYGCNPPNGYVAQQAFDDCDDFDSTVFPGGQELCDDFGTDEDCDGLFDDQDPDVIGGTTWYPDMDGDGYGDGMAGSQVQCAPPPDAIDNPDDCDDAEPGAYPGAAERCDGYDNNCDGLIDDADPLLVGGTSWYPDEDGDGHGAGVAIPACNQPPTTAATDTDCNDFDPTVNPDAAEVCDGADNDCDSLVDDADSVVLGSLWYLDADGDGWGVADTLAVACNEPVGYAASLGDCDDTLAEIYPGQTLVVAQGTSWPTLQGAIDLACEDGEIQVAAGTYVEQIDLLGKRLSIEAVDPMNRPVLDAPADPAITVGSGEPPGTTVADLVVRVQNPSGFSGTGVSLVGGADLTLRDMVFENLAQVGTDAMAVYVSGSMLTVEGGRFDGCDNGITAVGTSDVLVVDTVFQDGDAAEGAGINLIDGNLDVVGGVFQGNVVTGNGGAIFVQNATLGVYDTVFENNTGSVGGTISTIATEVWAERMTLNGGEGLHFDGGIDVQLRNTSLFNVDGSVALDVSAATMNFNANNLIVIGSFKDGVSAAASNIGIENVDMSHNGGVGFDLFGAGVGQVSNCVMRSNTTNVSVGGSFSWNYCLTDDAADVSLGAGNQVGAPTYLVEHPNLDPTLWNFHTEPGSLGFNAGDPSQFDDDGVSQSSIGPMGGALGDQSAYFLDADADGLPDGWEVQHFGDVHQWDGSGDPDGDGLTNSAELTTSYTAPADPDTDQDGAFDGEDAEPSNPGVQ